VNAGRSRDFSLKVIEIFSNFMRRNYKVLAICANADVAAKDLGSRFDAAEKFRRMA
jgi:hypothetical protein